MARPPRAPRRSVRRPHTCLSSQLSIVADAMDGFSAQHARSAAAPGGARASDDGWFFFFSFTFLFYFLFFFNFPFPPKPLPQDAGRACLAQSERQSRTCSAHPAACAPRRVPDAR